tara:strand:+ start:133 stop:1362 length:1230 start_codon:yes stop_codon:yes gene_type:complete
MEMIDVLKKLEEIATKSPEVAKAIEQVKQTNPKDVDTNAVESEKAVNQEPVKEYEDKIQEYQVKSYKDFLASKGLNIYKLKGDDHVKYSKMYKQEKDSAHQDATAKKGTDDHKTYTPSTADSPAKIEDETMEGGMKDYLHGEAERLSREEFLKKHGEDLRGFYNAINGSEDDEDDIGEGNAFAQAVQQAKAAGLKKGDKFKVGDEEHTLRDSDFEQVNTNTMENKEKEVVKEAIKISTDSPEEAGMMMQILALAGVKPVDASMMGGDQDQEHDHDGMKHSHPGGDQEHSHDDMRSMMDKIPSDDEKTDEEYANSPDEKTQDTDELLNVQSGGINKQKQQVRKEYPGDNPLAVEDKITEEELANTYRAQYENFKKAYQEAAKPDFLDMDKDGDKKEPMKKAVKDKEEKSK